MDLIPYLSAVILISTVATILLAVISYAAFKLRDKRRPKANAAAAPRFFHRYRRDDGLDGLDGAAAARDEHAQTNGDGARA